jgi:tetratricopeptide (TPR) repeat protein
MSIVPAQPVVFISYSHKDEPDQPQPGEVRWLSEIQSYLSPALKNGCPATYELWDDREIAGGSDWRAAIDKKLAACAICVLLLSRYSLYSDFVLKVEVETVRTRQRRGEDVQLFPIVLSGFPDSSIPAFLSSLQFRPDPRTPLSGMSGHAREKAISKIADEIVGLLRATPVATPEPTAANQPAYVHITGLPETLYENLVGRDAELARLDAAWADPAINIISLVAEGGAGKSALVSEWLGRLQADNYRGAEMVLGWSFYSQGTKERATSADGFLDWVLNRLDLKVEVPSVAAKAEAIANALMRRRVLLVLDGVEPLQHGPGPQPGQLKDQGLRALLRHIAAAPPAAVNGLVVLSSRLAVADLARWRGGAAPVVDVEHLSDAAGAALLRDNHVWGTDRNLQAASRDFGGHPLALQLLAGLLDETRNGDVRRRDQIRAFLADPDNPRHDHARRVLESYETEWLAGQPELVAIMQLVGLFDRPANAESLAALRAEPVIAGLTDRLVAQDDATWQRAVARLRAVRLLLPADTAAPGALDAHPLVREWFGERLRQTNEAAWRETHARLYKHLRDTTREGAAPTLADLAPLYQAIAHGCRAGRHQQTLDEVYWARICRRGEFYTRRKLGAIGSDLAAVSWFFDKPFEVLAAVLRERAKSFVLAEAAYFLGTHGRFAEALPAGRACLRLAEEAGDWNNAATVGFNLSESELFLGKVADALGSAVRAVEHADQSGDYRQEVSSRARHGAVLHAAGRRDEARAVFANAERRQRERESPRPLLYSVRGGQYCDLLLDGGEWTTVREQATQTLQWSMQDGSLLSIALNELSLGRAELGLALSGRGTADHAGARRTTGAACHYLDRAGAGLRASESNDRVPPCLLARAGLRRALGDWDGAVRELDEVEEIAGPGPMRLYLCDLALERTRLALARCEAFAPLNGLIDDSPPKPEPPNPTERERLHTEAAEQLRIAADCIETCGYHRRDEELAELQAVLRAERSFASLPPRV